VSKGAPDLQWHRTSPIAVVFFLFNAARQLATNGLPAIVVVTAAFASGGAARKALMATGLLAFILFSVFWSILSWLRFRFCISDDRVLVRSGVLQREELSVEFNRIQNINIREPFYMRPFGLAVLGIDTAGSSQKEILLGGIKKDLAVQLRETLLSRAMTGPGDNDVPAEEFSDPSLLLSRETRDIVIYGLTVNFILWVAIALGAFFGAWDTTEQVAGWLVERLQINDVVEAAKNGRSLLGNTLLLVGAALAAFLLLPLISVLGALFKHHGYRLSVDGETYRKAGGLLTLHEESLKRHKIQAIVLKQNVVARLFRRSNMQLRVASAGSGIESGQLPGGAKATFLVPALHPPEANGLCEEFFPGCDIENARFSRIDRRRFMTLILGIVSFPALAFSLPLGLFFSWAFGAILPITLGLAWLAANRYWQRAGYAVVGDYGFIRHGIIGTVSTVFPLFKVQRIDIRQTPGQRRRGLAHLSIHLASHSLSIPYVPIADAEQLRDLALYYAETAEQAWY
jgi:putative membrane protein